MYLKSASGAFPLCRTGRKINQPIDRSMDELHCIQRSNPNTASPPRLYAFSSHWQ